jgi:hypothetical protein
MVTPYVYPRITHRLIATWYDNALAIGREGCLEDKTCVAFELGQQLAVGRGPQSLQVSETCFGGRCGAT